MRVAVSAVASYCAFVWATAQVFGAEAWQVSGNLPFEAIFERAPSAGTATAYRGAVLLRWDRERFREFSGLHLIDGDRMMAVSDRGALLHFAVALQEGRIAGASSPVLNRLRGVDGGFLEKDDGDAESMTSDGEGGVIVSFERRPRLLRYRPPFTGAPAAIDLPPAIAEFPKNRGIEALTRLCDGTLLVLAQGASSDAPNAWVGGADRWTGRHYVRTDGYSPTGATTLRDCSVLVLERRKTADDSHAFRIRRLTATSLQALGDERLRAAVHFGPLVSRHYKFEGVTSARHEAGNDLLYVISDSGRKKGTVLAAFAIPAVPTQ